MNPSSRCGCEQRLELAAGAVGIEPAPHDRGEARVPVPLVGVVAGAGAGVRERDAVARARALRASWRRASSRTRCGSPRPHCLPASRRASYGAGSREVCGSAADLVPRRGGAEPGADVGVGGGGERRRGVQPARRPEEHRARLRRLRDRNGLAQLLGEWCVDPAAAEAEHPLRAKAGDQLRAGSEDLPVVVARELALVRLERMEDRGRAWAP